ncbi:uncharacterized protein LOC132282173 [Cornus florida]|uniref:uncharacterized protein LOC132282173 n=1 Tax=Cornus florida TaxID=4283 RepID=UPI0028962D75|nr:uncharacterized protein LOC132282173 [Cornus florida]
MARGLVRHRIGAGNCTSMWMDYWLPNGPITMQLGLSDVEILQLDPRVTVDSLISNNQWEVPISLQQIPFFQSQAFTLQLQNIQPPSHASDKVEWIPSSPNEYSHRLTMEYFTPPNAWDQLVWFKHRIPKHGYIVWLALKKRLATLDTKPMMTKHYTNACYLCLAQAESLDHIFFKCQFSSRIWEFVQHAAGFYIKPDSWNDMDAGSLHHSQAATFKCNLLHLARKKCKSIQE